jgi:hypothetical protein
MKRLYTLALKEAYPNFGLQFEGLKKLFDENGFLMIKFFKIIF